MLQAVQQNEDSPQIEATKSLFSLSARRLYHHSTDEKIVFHHNLFIIKKNSLYSNIVPLEIIVEFDRLDQIKLYLGRDGWLLKSLNTIL